MNFTTPSQAAAMLSKLGAKKGGLARAMSQTKKQRKILASKAAKQRWRKYRMAKRLEKLARAKSIANALANGRTATLGGRTVKAGGVA